MDAPGPSDGLLFDAFWFDRRAGALFRRDEGGALDPVAIGSRALAVLSILMARQGGLVSKDDIMQAVWPGTVVEDNNLTVQVSALRRVLDQGRAGTSCIQTIPGRLPVCGTGDADQLQLSGPAGISPATGQWGGWAHYRG